MPPKKKRGPTKSMSDKEFIDYAQRSSKAKNPYNGGSIYDSNIGTGPSKSSKSKNPYKRRKV